jgi:outer membrane biosynthesis protein TonB
VRPPAFSPGQVVGAVSLASLVQGGVVLCMVLARSTGGASLQREPAPREMRIAVKPMLDAPLLKKGTQAPPPKLPDMWKPPDPEVLAAVRKPLLTPETKKPLAPADPKPSDKPHDKPPPETPQARRVDDMVKQMQREAEESEPPEVAKPTEEGGEDGVSEGTEKDPLKARATDSYKVKLQKWFQEGFHAPVEELDCATLLTLRARVKVQIGADREVTSYSMEPSGNEVFDQRVRAAMEAHVGQAVPPPPPNFPELLERVFYPTFVGENEKCK